MNQTQSQQQQQPNRSMSDNDNFYNNNNLYNNNCNHNQQGLNTEGSIMFDNMPNDRLDEQMTDPYGSSSKPDEVHSSHTLIQVRNLLIND